MGEECNIERRYRHIYVMTEAATSTAQRRGGFVLLFFFFATNSAFVIE